MRLQILSASLMRFAFVVSRGVLDLEALALLFREFLVVRHLFHEHARFPKWRSSSSGVVFVSSMVS
jgi:hypothetical protein